MSLQGGPSSDEQYCLFSGIDGSFTFLFIPVLCFEIILFALAAKVYYDSARETNELRMSRVQGEGGSSFIKVLAKDSLYYFFA